MKVSVVIPCYYSEQMLRGTVDEIIKNIYDFDYEIILVNDGSADGTYDIIKDIAEKNDRIIGINLASNVGQHNATMAGFNYVTGDRVLVCSDDGQSPIEAFDDMMSELDNGSDCVCVYYESRKQIKPIRRLGSRLALSTSGWLIDKPKDVYFSFDFMADAFVVKEMVRYNGPYSSIEGLLFRTTKNVTNIVAPQHNRKQGKSGYTFKKLLALWLNGFTAFSIKPLRISTFVGFTFSFVGFIYALVTLIRRLMGAEIQLGWSSVIIILLVGLGFIMVLLGLIGEYVGRIYMCINNSPQYVIKEVVRRDI